jgi:phage tail sheath protein FI
MAFQLSPGVLVTEKDLTNVIPAVSTSAGAFVGNFNWGPVGEIFTVGSENDLRQYFGLPLDSVDWFTAANFLAYGNNLQLVRAAGTGAENSTAERSGVFIPNRDVYEAEFANGGTPHGEVAAKYPGLYGNSLAVQYADATSFADWDYASFFDAAPGTSLQADEVGCSNDELHIVVIDTLGRFSGAPGTVVERFAFASKQVGNKLADGTNNYYKEVLNQQSQYIWWMNHPSGRNWGGTAGIAFDGTEQDGQTAGQDALVMDLNGGANVTASTGDLQDAYSLFANKEIVDISLVLTGDHAAAVVNHAIDNVALSRLDCVVFLSPPLAAVYNNAGSEAADVVEYRQTDINRNTSYAVMDSGWKRQYDRYNDQYINVPLNADTAGLCARTDQTNDAWWSPAGFNRGQLKNIVKLVWSPNQTERDQLYKNGVNPVATFPGEGTLLYGDKTMLAKPSAFDRINVRRLFIVLEKAIATAAKYQLFEFNDVFSRAQFRSLVEPFLRDVRGRRGIFDFRVVCDETNNTGEVIDRNEFVADIYIKPARSINFIYLNFVAVRTSVSFTEVGA